jgi:hypothetical protein
MAKELIRIDSARNCLIRWLLDEPNTFRTPTSLALLADLAVDKFIKLIHASVRISKAIPLNK